MLPTNAMLTLNNRVRSLGRRYIAAQVVVVLLFGPHIANLFEETTRYLYNGRSLDAFLLVSDMVLLAGM